MLQNLDANRQPMDWRFYYAHLFHVFSIANKMVWDTHTVSLDPGLTTSPSSITHCLCTSILVQNLKETMDFTKFLLPIVCTETDKNQKWIHEFVKMSVKGWWIVTPPCKPFIYGHFHTASLPESCQNNLLQAQMRDASSLRIPDAPYYTWTIKSGN